MLTNDQFVLSSHQAGSSTRQVSSIEPATKAAPGGLEPPLVVLETTVLPLNEGAIFTNHTHPGHSRMTGLSLGVLIQAWHRFRAASQADRRLS